MKPLEGYRVVDFGRVWSGPMVTAILADLGAEVIKIEHHDNMDNARLRGRPTIDGRRVEGPTTEVVPYFHNTNRGKRSVTLNIKDPRGVDLVKRLVAVSDALTHNLGPRVLARAGLDYEHLRQVRPDLVMLSMYAAGESGPRFEIRAYAPIMTSMMGLEGLVGYADGTVTGMMTYGCADPNAALHATFALLVALYHRERTGEGQHIEMSQVSAIGCLLAEPVADFLLNGRVAGPRGNDNPDFAPHGIYPCAGEDRWVAVAVKTDAEWRGLCQAIGRPELADRPEFRTHADRRTRLPELDRVVAEWTRARDPEDAAARLQAAGVAAGPVLGVEAHTSHPYFRTRGTRVPCPHPYIPNETVYALPWRLAETPAGIGRPAPLIGQDNEQILGGLLGLEHAEIAELVAARVVY